MMSAWRVRSLLRTAGSVDSSAVLTKYCSFVLEGIHSIKPRPTNITRSLYTCTSSAPPLPLPQGSSLPCTHTRHAGGSLAASGILTPKFSCVCIIRSKSKKATSKVKSTYNRNKKGSTSRLNEDEDSDDDETDTEDEDDMKLESGGDFREVRARVASLRMDAVLKAGANMSRNKVESAFYASKIRVNGKKLLKKSHKCHEGDEIDIFKSVSKQNSKNIYITRVVIMAVSDMDEDDDDDKLTVRLRRYPNLMVESYEDFKAPVEDE